MQRSVPGRQCYLFFLWLPLLVHFPLLQKCPCVLMTLNRRRTKRITSLKPVGDAAFDRTTTSSLLFLQQYPIGIDIIHLFDKYSFLLAWCWSGVRLCFSFNFLSLGFESRCVPVIISAMISFCLLHNHCLMENDGLSILVNVERGWIAELLLSRPPFLVRWVLHV